MLNLTEYYNLIVEDHSNSLATAGAAPAVSRAKAYYLNNIRKVQTIDQFMNNTKRYTCAMTAYGLSGMLNEKGLVRQVLEQVISRGTALANTLSNTNFKALATALNFQANGSSTTSTISATTGTAAQYEQQALDSQIGQQSPGVQMALYFKQNVTNISSHCNILGDATLRKCVETELGLSGTISEKNIDTRAQLFTNAMSNAGVGISSLQNTTTLNKFLDRFTANYDASHTSAVSTTLTSALGNGSPGIGSDLLLSIANLKLGGS